MNKQTKKELIEAKNIIGITLALGKSFFMAVTQVAWGLVSLYAFNALISYLALTQKLDVSLVSPMFLKLETFIVNSSLEFVVTFFVLYAYFEIKEVIKK